MKSSVQEPTIENVAKSIVHDSYGRNNDIFQFIDFLTCIDGPFCLSIDGRWGSGKTFFVQETNMIINYLWERTYLKDVDPNSNSIITIMEYNNLQDSLKKGFKGIVDKNTTDKNTKKMKEYHMYGLYYNAWKNDFHSNPLLSLVWEIILQTSLRLSSDIDILNIAGKLIKSLSQVSKSPNMGVLAGIAGLIANWNPGSEKDILAAIKAENSFDTALRTFIDELTEQLRNSKLVLFIDELDRCKPDFAIRLLEQLQHYLKNDKIIIVCSVNAEQLQHTIRQYYGDGFDAIRYLDKVFDFRGMLPEVNQNILLSPNSKKPQNYMNLYNRMLLGISEYFKFTIREFIKFNDCMKALTGSCYFNAEPLVIEDAKVLGIRVFVPIMVGLQMTDLQKHDDFINGKGGYILEDMILKIPDLRFIVAASWNSKFRESKEGINELIGNLKSIYGTIFTHPGNDGTSICGVRVSWEYKEEIINASTMITNHLPN